MEQPVAKMIYFISGHIDLSKEEFSTNYIPLIDKACEDPTATFVVGDCYGADGFAQIYLHYLGRSFVVYHKGNHARVNPYKLPTVGGYISHTAKDQAMTEASDLDIAWVRPGKETSGTASNLRRRRIKEKYVEMFGSDRVVE